MTNALVYDIFCGGRFIKTSHTLEVANPYNNSIAGYTYLADSSVLDLAIQSATDVLKEMVFMPSFKKYRILMQISEELYSLRQQMAELISAESGKPLKFALSEVDRSIQTFKIAAEESKRIPAECMSLDWTAVGEGKEGFLKYFPAGIMAGISPFNFPLNLAVHKIAPAIAAGCPLILKPSSTTPLSTLLLSQIIHRTELPGGAVSVLPMDRQTGNLLVTHPDIAILSFTGSPEVGWKMKTDAGKKRVILELGGNAGVVVATRRNLDNIVQKCVLGSFAYSGQVCIHTQRIYVLKEFMNEFLEMFLAQTAQLKSGNPMFPDTDFAEMIDASNAIRVENWINEAVADGAKLLAGGKRVNNFVEPTVLTATREHMKVCCEEIFGPVVVLEETDTLEDAVVKINRSKFGLQAGIFTDSISHMNYAFNHLKVGGVIINDVPTFRVDHMPYGGIKDSGIGREGVKYAMLEMMEPRLLVKNSI